MRVYAVMSFGDLDLGYMALIPSPGDVLVLPDGSLTIAKRLFNYERSLTWYGQVRREWKCRLLFEGLP